MEQNTKHREKKAFSTYCETLTEMQHQWAIKINYGHFYKSFVG